MIDGHFLLFGHYLGLILFPFPHLGTVTLNDVFTSCYATFCHSTIKLQKTPPTGITKRSTDQKHCMFMNSALGKTCMPPAAGVYCLLSITGLVTQGRLSGTGHGTPSSPGNLARMGHFPPASQSGFPVGSMLYVSLFSGCDWPSVSGLAEAPLPPPSAQVAMGDEMRLPYRLADGQVG
jgi:hypothetical protein